jgi:type II secretory pathway pseudopilin PulG
MKRYFEAGVVAVAGVLILSAAGPNILLARNRSRQKHTMADIRTLATALEARATDMNSYSIGAAPDSPVGTRPEDFGTLRAIPLDELARVLEPTYIKTLPRTDGWGQPLEVRIGDYTKDGQAALYAIRSPGSDRRADADSYTGGTNSKMSEDLVYSNGSFFRYPEVS